MNIYSENKKKAKIKLFLFCPKPKQTKRWLPLHNTHQQLLDIAGPVRPVPILLRHQGHA